MPADGIQAGGRREGAQVGLGWQYFFGHGGKFLILECSVLNQGNNRQKQNDQ
jgi:hypothetical protein